MASNDGSSTEDVTIKVGSIVRAPRTSAEKPKGRAMVAMIQEDGDEQSVCLLWEPCIPQPLANSSKFLVSPVLACKPTTSNDDDEETTLDRFKIQPLLDFESDNSTDSHLINQDQEILSLIHI